MEQSYIPRKDKAVTWWPCWNHLKYKLVGRKLIMPCVFLVYILPGMEGETGNPGPPATCNCSQVQSPQRLVDSVHTVSVTLWLNCLLCWGVIFTPSHPSAFFKARLLFYWIWKECGAAHPQQHRQMDQNSHMLAYHGPSMKCDSSYDDPAALDSSFWNHCHQ